MSSEDWTAVGTIALAVVTVVYVRLTNSISKAAERSAKAAERSAEDARRAAEAMEATIPISFAAAPDMSKGRHGWAVRNTGGNVWFHGVVAYRCTVVGGGAQEQVRPGPVTLVQFEQRGGQVWPVRLHKGENTGAMWPNMERVKSAHLRVIYSIRLDGEREGCFCQMMSPGDYREDGLIQPV